MNSYMRHLVHGVLAGTIGAACMTPLRVTARRAGWIRKTVPQAVEESFAEHLRLRDLIPVEMHQAADTALHLGYGATLGALYALLPPHRAVPLALSGSLLGVSTWVFGSALLPALDAGRPPWASNRRENTVNLAAHLVYGLVTALLMDDLRRERGARPDDRQERMHKPVG